MFKLFLLEKAMHFMRCCLGIFA